MSNKNNSLKRFGEYGIDLEKKVLWYENEPCDLPVKAVELLCVLVENDGRVVTKDDLLEAVWPDSFVEESVLPQNVYLLRKLFKEHGSKENLIRTMPRRGYRFAGQLEEESEDEIIIERETFERKLIAEADLSDEEMRTVLAKLSPEDAAQIPHLYRSEEVENRPPKTFRRKLSAVYLTGLTLLLAVLGGGFVFWFYPNYTERNSAKALTVDNRHLKYESLTESGRIVAVGLSPDDRHAAYVVNTADNLYKMVLRHLPTGSETVVVKPQKIHLANISFSPDGHYIFYLGRDNKEKLTVYRMPLYGGVSQPVLKDLTHYFSVSPDGEWLAFFRRVPEEPAHYLEIARSADGSGRRTVTVRRDKEFFSVWGTAPAWSPDGKKMLAAAFTKNDDETKPARNHLVEIDVAGGRQTDVKTPPEWRSLHEPYYSADGRNIYLKVRAGVGEPVQIWRLEKATGAARNLTNDSNDYREFRVAADGSFIVSVVWSKSENLFLVPTEKPDDFRQLTFDTQGNNGAEGLAWTVDGKNLVYTKSNGFGIGNIWTIDTETGEERQLTQEKKKAQGAVEVTPDGKSIVYVSSRSGTFQLWRMDFDGSNLKQLTDGPDIYFGDLSPDGKWIYYSQNGLWKKPLAGGDSVKVLDKSMGGMHFSPTAPKVFSAYYHDPAEKEKDPWMFVIFNLDSLSAYKDLEIDTVKVGDWTPDGRKLYYIGSGESFHNIRTIAPETLEKEQITNFQDQRISNLSLSPDGKTLALSRGISVGKVYRISGF
jgi:Tol biopolymer transport system component/DNA-binding winged helix-turn-helix (wHTH) protein